MAEASLLAEVPRVGRARGFRLYDTAGRRLVDLWQAGGGAILGHRPLRASNALKDALARGLTAPLVSPWEARLLKALAVRFPSYRAFRLHATLERALAAASRWLGRRVEPADLADPGLGTPGCGPVGLWRPFLPEGGDPRPRVLVPVLPCSVGGSPAALCFADHLAEADEPSDPVPGALLAAALRGLLDLARADRSDPFGPDDLAGAAGWERRGPYLCPTFPEAVYPAVFRAFLARGALLSPFFPGPSILPGEASAGERRLVSSLFRSFPGG